MIRLQSRTTVDLMRRITYCGSVCACLFSAAVVAKMLAIHRSEPARSSSATLPTKSGPIRKLLDGLDC
jgi:hypothetical protein